MLDHRINLQMERAWGPENPFLNHKPPQYDIDNYLLVAGNLVYL